MRADDLRVELLEVRIGEPELLRNVAAQIRSERIGARHQIVQHLLALGFAEIQRHAFLVAIEAVIENAVVLGEEERTDVARDVAAVVGILDLDDLGALVGEKHGAEGAGAVLLDGEHANALERQGHAGFRSTSCLAMMMRCISLVPSPMASSGASR